MINIRVGYRHIAAGIQKCGSSCAVALAVQEQTPWSLASVDEGRIWKGMVAESDSVEMPEEVRVFVSDFDDGEDVLPFDFEIDIPVSAQREKGAA